MDFRLTVVSVYSHGRVLRCILVRESYHSVFHVNTRAARLVRNFAIPQFYHGVVFVPVALSLLPDWAVSSHHTEESKGSDKHLNGAKVTINNVQLYTEGAVCT